MFRILFAVLIFLSLSAPARAQSEDIPGIIGSQIEAFKVDDFSTAFTFASPLIKQMFGTPERFGIMVQRGYPMVWRPADVQYLDQRTDGAFTYQKVLIKDGEGTFFTFEYEMIQTPDGWQINGVHLIQDPAVSA